MVKCESLLEAGCRLNSPPHTRHWNKAKWPESSRRRRHVCQSSPKILLSHGAGY